METPPDPVQQHQLHQELPGTKSLAMMILQVGTAIPKAALMLAGRTATKQREILVVKHAVGNSEVILQHPAAMPAVQSLQP